MTCSCGRIAVGMTLTASRNWNPDCEEHGTQSDWFAEHQKTNERLHELQRLAREARQARRRT